MKKLNVILKTWIPKSKQIRQAGEKTDICVDTGSLPEIPGVETRTGLNNAGGTVRVYMDVLEDYCQSVKDRLVQIKEAAENRDFELYTTLVHGIKGASHSVGAMTCGDYAVALEEAGKNKDERKIQEKTGELLELFSRQIQTITMALCQYQNEQKTAKKTGLSDLHMEKLKKALSDMDIETVNRLLMEFSLAALEGKIKETVSEIEQHVLMFEYDKALEKIDMLL
jgi:HPt (histidine-containing phosphotransfer) domain-containing protein